VSYLEWPPIDAHHSRTVMVNEFVFFAIDYVSCRDRKADPVIDIGSYFRPLFCDGARCSFMLVIAPFAQLFPFLLHRLFLRPLPSSLPSRPIRGLFGACRPISKKLSSVCKTFSSRENPISRVKPLRVARAGTEMSSSLLYLFLRCEQGDEGGGKGL
jgi:hypothetical protein